jgi:DNA-binding NarL/FixJ family response regulator
MVTMALNKLKQLEVTKAKMAALLEQITTELNKELRALPQKYGFTDVDDFVRAVKAAAGGKGKGKGAGGKARRKRAVITDETRAEVKKLVGAGKTGNEIAEKLGISLPSVQNIKKALGLVKAR